MTALSWRRAVKPALALVLTISLLGLVSAAADAEEPPPPEAPAASNFDTEVETDVDVTTPPVDLGPLDRERSHDGVWQPMGPHEIINGQVEGLNTDPVIGAVHDVATHPTNADILWLGAANGGVWRTDNATAALPTWVPLTDFFPASIGAVELDPTDGSANTLVAGNGRMSAFAQRGSNLNGMIRSTDGGFTWTELLNGGTGAPWLVGENISGLAPRGATIVAASNGFFGTGGLWRTTDTGTTFTQISGGVGTGLPAGAVFDLVGDPSNNAVLYASVQSTGLFRSANTGATWTNISSGDVSFNAAITAFSNNNTEMAVSPTTGRVFVGVMQSGQVAYIGYSDNPGAATPTWTEMDLPIMLNADGSFDGAQPRNKPGAQGNIHFSIAVDPANDDLLYLGGDRQDNSGLARPANWPNAIGANDFSGSLWRGDASVAAVAPGSTTNAFSPQWEHLTHTQNLGFAGGGTASGSAPHADSRDMEFDANGRLIEGDDGGIYRRSSPQDNTGDWFSMIGTGLQITEIHDIAYDTNSDVLISGNQDVGTSQQVTGGSMQWTQVFLTPNPGFADIDYSTGDGGDVAVDTTSVGGGNSIRYSSFPNLFNFRRIQYNSGNTQIGSPVYAPLTSTGAAIGGQFVTPLELNAITPTRLILGDNGNGVYESTDQGANITPLVGPATVNRNAMAYGGSSGGGNNADVIYVGSGSNVWVRTGGGAFSALTNAVAYPGGNVLDVVMDPNDFNTAFAIDSNQVFMTPDAGTTWTDVTGNLVDTDLRTITFVPGTPDEVLVGGRSGVNHMRMDSVGAWGRFGTVLPNVLVFDLVYDATDGLVVAGTLGRGAWTFDVSQSTADPVMDATDIGGTGQDEGTPDTYRIVRNGPALEVWINGSLSDSFTYASLNSITINGSGDDDTLTVDFSGGSPVAPPNDIAFNGGSGPSDALRLEGGTVGAVTHDFIDETDGTIDVDGQVISYTGLEPIVDLLGATARTFNYLAATETITLADDGTAADGVSFIDSTGTEDVTFANPASSLIVNAGAGNDVVNVSGPDTVLSAAITINAGEGNDRVNGGTASAPLTINGGPGKDTLSGSPAGNTIDGGTEADTLRGAAGRDIMSGGPGADRLLGGDNSDRLIGGADNDNLIGNQGDDYLSGGDGADTIRGGPGLDLILGGASGDNLRGGSGADTILGGPGADTIGGDSGSDELSGGSDADTIKGGNGDDLLRGGPGNDTLNGGKGIDICRAGETLVLCEL